MSRDIHFLVVTTGGGRKVAANHPTMLRTVPTTRPTSAEVEKPCYIVVFHHVNIPQFIYSRIFQSLNFVIH